MTQIEIEHRIKGLELELRILRSAEEEIVRQNDALSKLNHFAIELSNMSYEDNLEELISKKIKEMSGAEVSTFSEFDPENHITSVKCIELEPGMLNKVVKLLGKKIQNIHSPISQDMYEEISHDLVGWRKTLHEVSFGAISRPVGASVQALLNIDHFIGLAYMTEGKLYGTSVLGMKKHQPDPPKKILENFVHLAATSLQRKQIEKQLKIKIEELINTNKKLEQYAHANEELEQFAFIASHNLQQPLRTVSNYVQIFEEDYADRFDDKAFTYLKTVKDSVSRMMLLLNSLLDFSRIGRNIKLKKVSCKQLINNIVADLETLITSTQATIKVSAMPEIKVYESEFSQLIQNLIMNAIKFQKPGNKPKIMISSKKINSGWQFSISDNGIGIASKYFEKIFEIFQRLHNDSEYQGSGIGLAFCKKIVQLHKGIIWIESAEDQGTTVHFSIADLEE
jgi:signal transduction histidine kinase